MSRRHNFLFQTVLLSLSFHGVAGEIMLGDVVATHRMTCGKAIDLLFADVSYPQYGHTLIGLRNKETDQIDLFLSSSASAESRPYEKFNRVYFDNLSKNYVKTAYNLSLVWGAARATGQKEDQFRLAFGEHSYACGKIVTLADEIAYKLYGEKPTD